MSAKAQQHVVANAEPIDLFICHTGVDKPTARELGESVESFSPGGTKLRVFLDEWDIDLGENIVVRLNGALARARYVAVLMTPEMMQSDWCQAELASVLADDPTNRRGRLLPILLRDRHLELDDRLEIPPFLRALNRLDFRSKKLRREGIDRIGALLCGGPSGRTRRSRHSSAPPAATLARPLPARADLPDEDPESLISNLLLVSEVPPTVWTARTNLRRLRDLPRDVYFPPLIPREGRLISFHDPSEGALSRLVCGPIERVSAREWRDREDRWPWVIELLNRTLQQDLYRAGIRFDVKHRRFYFASNGDKKVRLRWGIGRSRSVVRPPDPGKGGYWVHHAARLSFESFGNDLYLAIDPTWVFTKDGRMPVPRDAVPNLAARWGGRERNGAILRNILLWADVITQGRARRRLPCGAQSLRIERIPRTVEVPVGLRSDHTTVRALLAFSDTDTPPDPSGFGFVKDDDDGEHRDEA